MVKAGHSKFPYLSFCQSDVLSECYADNAYVDAVVEGVLVVVLDGRKPYKGKTLFETHVDEIVDEAFCFPRVYHLVILKFLHRVFDMVDGLDVVGESGLFPVGYCLCVQINERSFFFFNKLDRPNVFRG